MGKRLILFFLLIFSCIYSDSESNAQTGSKKIVSTVSALKTAVQNAVPGDTIEVADGTYNFNGNLSLTKSGTEDYPIIIRALNRGKAELTSKSYFTCKRISHVIIEGFLFTSTDVTAVKTESCSNIRITRNIFRLKETSSLKWIVIGGTYNLTEPESFNNRIDHNIFEEKHKPGNFITIDGSPEPNAKSSQFDRIDHNYFKNIGPRVENEMEAVRIGWSEMSLSSGYTIVEHNLFENCDGDPEIISVKTCDNIIRNNTFISCQGSLVLRHGNRNVVEGNFFIGNKKNGTGGVRFYGDDHKIFNNYFEGLTGTTWDAAITVTNGDADYPSSNLSKHFRPRRTVIAFNTMINNDHNIEIGYTNNGSYNKVPADITFANNIVQGNKNELVKITGVPQNISWQGNIFFPYEAAVTGINASIDEIKIVDPKLNLLNGYFRLSENSPAVNSASGNFDFVLNDIDGEKRDESKDIGADEFSTGIPFYAPLTPNDVGPDAGDRVVPVELISFNSSLMNNTVHFNWQTASEINNHGFILERKNITENGAYEKIHFIPGKGTTTFAASYECTDILNLPGKYHYRLQQIDFDGSSKFIAESVINYSEELKYNLYQNYPNPFNPVTLIKYSLPVNSFVSLKIFDALGNKIADLINTEQPAGEHEFRFDASAINQGLSSGVYLYKLTAGDYSAYKKLLLLK